MESKNKYSANTILALTAAINGNEEAYAWLKKNEFPELALFVDHILYDVEGSFSELAKGPHNEIAAFADALLKNRSALEFLIAQNFTALAATANSALGDEEAIRWLESNDMEHYVELGMAIQHMMQPTRSHSGTAFMP